MTFNSIYVLNIHGFVYRCIIVGISKSEIIRFIKSADLNKKSESLINIETFFYHVLKMNKEIITFGNTEIENVNFIIIKIQLW